MIVIVTSVILLAGMLFIPAKQIERAYAQANVSITQPQGSMDQVGNQIAQMVTKYNPGATDLRLVHCTYMKEAVEMFSSETYVYDLLGSDPSMTVSL